MKKRLLAIALCLCTAFSVSACGDDEVVEKEKKVEGKITLGEYKGLEVDASLATASEEEVDEYLQSVLESYSTTEELSEGVLEKDGKAKVSYTSTVDGEEYKNSEGATISLTEDGFSVDGFVDGLIGHSVGETVELDLTLPKDFSDKEVAGKGIHFSAKIEAKLNTVVPEFTDEFVSSNFDYLDLKTKDDLIEYLNNDIIISKAYSEIWQEILDNATVESYGTDELQDMVDKYTEYQEYVIYMQTGYELVDYLELIGKTADEFKNDMTEAAKSYLKQEMLIDAIAEKEGIEITDEFYQEKMYEFARLYGYDSVEEYEKAYEGSKTKEDFELDIRAFEVQELVCKSVKYVENLGLRSEKETSSEGETTEGASEETTSGEE